MKRPDEKTSCVGKFRHDDREAALNHLFALVRSGSPMWQLQVYRCRFCRTYHVGHRLRGRRVA
jgi:hypothetical protein